jgi:hypothetical protein
VDQPTTSALLTGGFALAGGLGGVLLSGRTSRRADERRLRAEDERRWLTDRRAVYAAFLSLAGSMLREFDSFAVFLPYSGREPVSEEDEQILSDGLLDYTAKWDNVLQPALGEVELLASPKVADLADRMTGALMEVTVYVERRLPFESYYPVWFQAEDLLEVLKDAMRLELGLPQMVEGKKMLGRRADDWPWLPDRPNRESYIQRHGPPQEVGDSDARQSE